MGVVPAAWRWPATHGPVRMKGSCLRIAQDVMVLANKMMKVVFAQPQPASVLFLRCSHL